MKRLLLGLIIMSVGLYAWSTHGSAREGNHEIVHYIKCDNGELTLITENTDIKKFFPGATSSMDKAAKQACSKSYTKTKKSNTIHIKSGALVFFKRNGNDGIISTLTTELSYSSTSPMFRMTDKYGFITSKKASVSKLKYYPPHNVKTDKYKNYKKNGKFTTKLIDGYYKVKDSSNNVYFVRKNETY